MSDVPELNALVPENKLTALVRLTILPETEAIVPAVPPAVIVMPGVKPGVNAPKSTLPPPTVKTDPVVLMGFAKFNVPDPVIEEITPLVPPPTIVMPGDN